MPEREEAVRSAANAPADSGRVADRATARRDVAARVASFRRIAPQDRRPPQSVLPPMTSDRDGAESPWSGVLVLGFLAAATTGVLVWKPGAPESRGVQPARTASKRDEAAAPAGTLRYAAPLPPTTPATSSASDVPPPGGR